MRAVEVSRRLSASPDAVSSLLTPEFVVESEGRFAPKSVSESAGRTVVTAWSAGRPFAPEFTFQRLDDGFAYRQTDVGVPPATVETTLRLHPNGSGTELSARSRIRSPLPFLGSILARRRHADLERLCDRVESAAASLDER